MAEQRGFQQVGGSEPLFTGTNRRSERGELVWMALAISSLPVPVSPVIRMVERLLATCPTRASRRSMRRGRAQQADRGTPRHVQGARPAMPHRACIYAIVCTSALRMG